MVDSKSQEGAERPIDVDHLPAHLLDQEPLDGANPMPLEIEHRGALDTVALDDRLG